MTFAFRILTALIILIIGGVVLDFLIEVFWDGDLSNKANKIIVSILKIFCVVFIVYFTILLLVIVFICN